MTADSIVRGTIRDEEETMRLVPTTNKLLVRPTEESPWLDSGLYLPQTTREKPRRGEALAVGPKVWEVSPGDEIYYDVYQVSEIRADGRTFVVMTEAEVIAKVA